MHVWALSTARVTMQDARVTTCTMHVFSSYRVYMLQGAPRSMSLIPLNTEQSTYNKIERCFRTQTAKDQPILPTGPTRRLDPA